MTSLTFAELESRLFSNRGHMAGADRDAGRVKATSEIFTPRALCDKILDGLEENDPEIFKDPARTFIDYSCGDGNLLAAALLRRCLAGIPYPEALLTTFGIDVMPDNIDLCRDRLALKGTAWHADLKVIAGRNIICADAREAFGHIDVNCAERTSSFLVPE